MSRERDSKSVATAARRILDAFGHLETSDSSRVVYTEGDLNIGSEDDILEIIYRGTLVYRYSADLASSESVFEEHGDWPSLVKRIAASVGQSGAN